MRAFNPLLSQFFCSFSILTKVVQKIKSNWLQFISGINRIFTFLHIFIWIPIENITPIYCNRIQLINISNYCNWWLIVNSDPIWIPWPISTLSHFPHILTFSRKLTPQGDWQRPEKLGIYFTQIFYATTLDTKCLKPLLHWHWNPPLLTSQRIPNLASLPTVFPCHMKRLFPPPCRICCPPKWSGLFPKQRFSIECTWWEVKIKE